MGAHGTIGVAWYCAHEKNVRTHVLDAIDSSTSVFEVAEILGLGLSLPSLLRLLLPPMSVANVSICARAATTTAL